MDFAAYVLFDELYTNFDNFFKVVQANGLSVRILGLVSAYVAETNTVEVLSPLKRDGLPCILVDVTLLSEDFKRALSGEAGLDRLVQFIGRLSLSPENKKTWCLLAITYKFMDGVDLQSYEEVVRIARPYAKAINF